MRLMFVAAISVCCGCAHSVSDGVHTVRQGLHAVTPALAALPQEQWAQELRDEQRKCEAKDLETEEARSECLSTTEAYKRAQVLERFEEIYDEVAALLEEAEALAKTLEGS